MLTGDAAVNPGAPIICATAEVLANHALRDRELADIGLVVMDEFHFYTEPDRGWAWQVPLLLMPDTQFLLMSATLGETAVFEEDLTRRTGRETVAITGAERPVPLEFSWVLTAVHETIELLLRDDRGPDLRRVVHPGVRGGAGPGADQRRARLERPQGRDQGCRGRLPLRQGLRHHPAPAGAARGRGAPRGDAAEVPPARRDPRAGRAARRHLRHRHPRRRHQRADPHRAAHLPDQVRRAQAAGAARRASSTRSPGGPAGPASTPSATSWCRRPSTSSSTRRRSPRPATTRRSAARWCTRRPRRAPCRTPRRPTTASSRPRPSR